jgi:hypothetical protein
MRPQSDHEPTSLVDSLAIDSQRGRLSPGRQRCATRVDIAADEPADFQVARLRIEFHFEKDTDSAGVIFSREDARLEEREVLGDDAIGRAKEVGERP